MRQLILSIIFLATTSIVFAQQTPQYSLHTMDPLLLNPAVAGSTSMPEFKLHHRSQWVKFKDAPLTSSLSYHTTFKSKPNEGIGGYIFNDQVGAVRKTGFNLAYAHHIPVKTFFISMAASVSVVENALDGKNFNIKDPDNIAYVGMSEHKITPDVNLGFLAYNQNFYLGASVLQLVPLNVKYTSSNMKYVNHIYLTGGYRIRPTKGVDLEPSFMIQLVKNAPINIDVNIKAIMNRNLIIGASFRNDKALTAMFGYRFDKRYFIGYSYDIGILNEIGRKSIGSHEIILAFQWPSNKPVKPLFDLRGNVRGQLKKREY